MPDTEKTILLELRDSAKENRNEQYRMLARTTADRLSDAIDAFGTMPTRSALEAVNGLWAVACRLMKHQPKDDPPSAGAERIPEAMAA
jgi:hypothetical protein